MYTIVLISEPSDREHAISKDMLRRVGCRLVSAKPGDRMPPGCDVAIVDVPSPKLEATLYRLQGAHAPKALVFVRFGDGWAERLAMTLGADDVLCKPTTMVRLEISLRNLIRIRCLEHELTLLRTKSRCL